MLIIKVTTLLCFGTAVVEQLLADVRTTESLLLQESLVQSSAGLCIASPLTPNPLWRRESVTVGDMSLFGVR